MTASTRVLVLVRLRELLDELAVDAAHMLRDLLASYATVPVEALLPGIRDDMERGLCALEAARGPTEAELVEIERVAELRARQGVPLEEMLQGFQSVGRLVWDALRGEAEATRLPPAELVALTAEIWQWLDIVVVHAARAHRRVDLDLARQDESRRVGFLRGVMSGTLPPAQMRGQLATWGLSAAAAYIPFRARPTRDLPARSWLRELHESLGNAPRVVGIVDETVVGIAGRPPSTSSPDVVLGFGGAATVAALAPEFACAGRALDAAAALGLNGCHCLDSLGLRASIVSDDLVGEALLARYLKPLERARGGASELQDSVLAYLESGLAIEPAARSLVVHPNTLRQRLKRFEALTNASLDDARTLVEVWWALERRHVKTPVFGRWTDD